LDIVHKETIRCSGQEFFTGFETQLLTYMCQNNYEEQKYLAGWGAYINTLQNMQKYTYVPPVQETEKAQENPNDLPITE